MTKNEKIEKKSEKLGVFQENLQGKYGSEMKIQGLIMVDFRINWT